MELLTTLVILVATLFAIFFIVYLVVKPFRWVLKIIFNSLLGVVFLWVINIIGQGLGFHIPINLLTILIVGLLGIPGLIVLIVFNLLLSGGF